MNKLALQAVVALAGLIIGDASDAQVPPLESYGRPATVSTMAVSPDGSRVAFRRVDETMDAVFVVDRQTNEIIAAVDGSETNFRQISFIDQNRLLLFAEQASHINFRLTSTKSQRSSSYVFDVRSKEITQLLAGARRLYPYQSGLGRVVGHNAARDTYYMPAFIGEETGPPATYGLMEVTLKNTGGRVLEGGGEDTVDWIVDSAGNVLVEEEYDHEKDVRRFWGRDGKKRRLIYESGPDERRYFAVGLSEDERSLIVSALLPGSDYSSFFEMNMDDGSVGPPLFQEQNRSVERALIDSHRRVYGVEYSGFFPRYEFLDPEMTERVRAIQASLKSTATTLVDWTPDFRYLIFNIAGGWTSGAYVIVGPDSLKPKMLAATRESIPAAAVVPTSVIEYEARDGLAIPALLTVRKDVGVAGKAPLVVMPHGGPAAHDQFGFDWLVQYFASRGIAVLQPQFRGSTGFGMSLRRAGDGEWGAAMLTDLDDGVLRLIEDGLVDPERVCMAGTSYGGYAALAAGAFSPVDYKCLVAISGISDLQRWLFTERERYGNESRTVVYWKDMLGSANPRDRDLDAMSPVSHAENFKAPVLLVHGRQDAVVPMDQSIRMEKALKRARKNVELVKLDGEDHYLSGLETRIEALRAVAKFIDENL